MTTAVAKRPEAEPASPPPESPPARPAEPSGVQPACWETYGPDPLKVLDSRLGTLTVSFRGPLATPREDVEALALKPLAGLVRERLLKSQSCRDWQDLAGRLADAERDLAALAEKQAGAERDVRELPTRDGLTGEKLAARISKAQADAEALAGRIGAAGSGLAVLKRRAAQARQAADDELQRLLPAAAREVHDRLKARQREAYRALAEGGGALLSTATVLQAAISRLASGGRSLDLATLLAGAEAPATASD